jgi:hypothetical protein
MADDLLPCIDCGKIKTSQRDESGNPICAACSNARYFEDLRTGKRIELHIDRSKVRGSTVTQVQSLLERDEEDYNAANGFPIFEERNTVIKFSMLKIQQSTLAKIYALLESNNT